MKCKHCKKVTRFPRCRCRASDFEEKFPHCFICQGCAIKGGGKPVPWPVTCHSAQCPYCGETKTLSALRDYDWPTYKVKAIWD